MNINHFYPEMHTRLTKRPALYFTTQASNNKGADQTARMRRLVCAFVDRILQKQAFSWRGLIIKICVYDQDFMSESIASLHYVTCICM